MDFDGPLKDEAHCKRDYAFYTPYSRTLNKNVDRNPLC
jgi:hypothetical protein